MDPTLIGHLVISVISLASTVLTVVVHRKIIVIHRLVNGRTTALESRVKSLEAKR